MKVWEIEEASFAWFVGLFEGDGSFNLQKPHGRLYIGIDLTDIDLIERCYEMYGGKMYGPLHKKNENRGHFNVKPMYQWRLQKQGSVWPLVDRMYPYLSARRKTRIDEAKELRLAWKGKVV